MTERRNLQGYKLSTELAGNSELTVVNRHLRYRTDQVALNGHEFPYIYIDDENAAVAVAALDKRLGERSLFMILTERYPSQTVGWEIPAGGSERGESQQAAGAREIEEEGGIKAALWQQLPRQVENVGRGNSRADLFVAADITEVNAQPEATEAILDRGWFSFSDLEDMMLNGEISSGHTLASIALTNAFLSRHPDHEIARQTK